MKKLNLFFLVTFVLIMSLVVGVHVPQAAQPAQDWPKNLSWGSASVAGAYYIWVQAMANTLSKHLGIRVSNEPGGTGPSITMMSKGEMHLSGNWMEFSRWAVFGKETFAGKQVKNLRGLFRVYPTPFWIHGRADLGIKSVKDLKGKKFNAEYVPSPLIGYASKLMLQANGMTLADVKVGKVGSVGEAYEGLKGGSFDMVTQPLAPTAGSFQELARSMPIAGIPLSPSEIDFIRKEAPGFTAYTIKAGSFPGCEKDLPVVAVWSNVIALEQLPEDLVYAIMKTIFEHLEEIRPSYAELVHLTLANAIQYPAIPFHEGAVRYYKEKGIWNKEIDQLQKSMLDELRK